DDRESIASPEESPESAVAAEPALVEEASEDEDELDPELLEIFIEEVGEVLETLEEYTPRWEADNDDVSARTEGRRALDPLEGSGGMVRASVRAGLAWAVENVLNRGIDGNVDATPAIFAVVNAARGLMPALLDDFANGRPSALQVVERL